jgi:hypothetical protein
LFLSDAKIEDCGWTSWKFDDVKVGDKVAVVVNPARDGRLEGILDEITLADGRTIGGPRDFLKKPSENQ